MLIKRYLKILWKVALVLLIIFTGLILLFRILYPPINYEKELKYALGGYLPDNLEIETISVNKVLDYSVLSKFTCDSISMKRILELPLFEKDEQFYKSFEKHLNKVNSVFKDIKLNPKRIVYKRKDIDKSKGYCTIKADSSYSSIILIHKVKYDIYHPSNDIW